MSLPDSFESAEDRGPMKVLLVDDSPYFLKAATRFLAGLESTSASPPRTTAASSAVGAARDRPDLVLMDINMPGINGLAAVRRLKAVEPDFASSSSRSTSPRTSRCGRGRRRGRLHRETPLRHGRRRLVLRRARSGLTPPVRQARPSASSAGSPSAALAGAAAAASPAPPGCAAARVNQLSCSKISLLVKKIAVREFLADLLAQPRQLVDRVGAEARYDGATPCRGCGRSRRSSRASASPRPRICSQRALRRRSCASPPCAH